VTVIAATASLENLYMPLATYPCIITNMT